MLGIGLNAVLFDQVISAKECKALETKYPFGARERNEALRAIKHLARALWKTWIVYHRRSRVETKMHCIKLLGKALMAISFDRQITETKARAVVLNTFTKLATPNTQRVC